MRILRRLSVRAGEAATVSITGPPGSGRSSLLKEIKWHLQLEAVPVVELSFDDGDDPGGIAAAFGSQILWLGDDPAADGTVDGVAEGARSMEDALRAARSWKSTKPLVVLADDVDRAPRAFFELAGEILARGPGLILVGTADGAAETLFTSLPVAESHAVSLSPVSEEEIAAMLRAVAGRDDPATVRWIHGASGGNVAVASQAVELVAAAGPRFGADEETPWTRSQWMASRWKDKFAALDGGLRRLVAAVALHDEPVPPADAVRFASPAEGQTLETMLPAEFLRAGASGTLDMAAPFLKSIVRDLIDEKERRSVHGLWAGMLQGRPHARTSQLMHAIEAGRALEIRGAVLDEARQKQTGGRVAEAIGLLLGLLRSLPGDAPDAVEPQLLLAECFLDAGRIAEAAATLDAARAGENDPGGPRKRLLRGACLIAEGRVEKGIDLLQSLARSPAARGDTKSEAAVLISDALLRKGDYEGALAWVREGLAAGAGSGRSGVSLLLTEGTVHLYRHNRKRASESFARAQDAAAGGDDGIGSIKVLGCRAMAEQMWGNLPGALELYREAAGLCERRGSTGRLAQAYLNIATILHRQGDFDGAVGYYLSAIDYALRSGQQAILHNARTNYAMLLGFLGMIQQARFEAGRARRGAESLGQKVLEARILAVSAEVDARAGDLPAAEKMFRRAAALFAEAGNRWEEAEVTLEIVDTLLPDVLSPPPAGTLEEIEELLRRAGPIAFEAETSPLAARARLASARACFLMGDREGARRLAEQALHDCSATPQEFDDFSWQIHHLLAQMSLSEKDTDNARRHAEMAASIIETIEEKLPGRFRATFRQSHARRRVFETLHSLKGAAASPPAAEGPIRQMIARLMQINRTIAAERDLPSLIRLILDSAIDVTGAERGFLLMPDASGSPTVVVARDFDTLSVPLEHMEFSSSIARKVLGGGESIFTISATSDARFATARSVHELGLQSIICLPIRSPASVAGALYLEHRSARALRLPPEERDLLHAFADQAAIALENARLLHENRQRLDEIEKLSQERERLLEKKTRALSEARRFLRSARDLFSAERTFRGIVGASAGMQRLFEAIRRLDESDVPVVISGESGTGKELVARAIHEGSARRGKSFVAINCGALPPPLLESELFGHVKGAFTGASTGRPGILSTASGGTLLLDEIAAMPLKMQVDLLRVLQESKVRPVGSNQEEKVDVRVLAASQAPLETLVETGRFREDLYYRLRVVAVHLPPLRERTEDIPLLADHFLSGLSVKLKSPKKVLSRKAMKFLMEYPWPGNVRELENAILGAWIMEEGRLLDLENFHVLVEKERPAPGRPPEAAAGTERPRGPDDREKTAIPQEMWMEQDGRRQAPRHPTPDLLQEAQKTFHTGVRARGSPWSSPCRHELC
jgi:transcriptional regulator with GAF, ATPase, and Fis domain